MLELKYARKKDWYTLSLYVSYTSLISKISLERQLQKDNSEMIVESDGIYSLMHGCTKHRN